MSYELIREDHPLFVKEVRVGFFINRVENYLLDESFMVTVPGTSKKEFVGYEYKRSSGGLSIKTDLLWNAKPILKRIGFYGGVGINLGCPFFQKFSANRAGSIYLSAAELGMDPKLVIQSFDLERTFAPVAYGVSGILGLKFNASCYMNLFTEFSPGLQAVTYFPKTDVYTNWKIQFGVRAKLNVFDWVPKDEPKEPTPFY